MLGEPLPTTGIDITVEELGELRVPSGYDLGMGCYMEVLFALLVLWKMRISET